jgi:hypothetical protein
MPGGRSDLNARLCVGFRHTACLRRLIHNAYCGLRPAKGRWLLILRSKAMARKTTSSSSSSGQKQVGPRRRQSQARGPATHRRGKAAPAHRSGGRKWSKHVMETSDAMDLRDQIFKSDSSHEIAASLKRSAEHSRRRKGSAFQSAMSMLNFYINRAGRNLPKSRRQTLNSAKRSLREAFGREA